VGINEAVGIVYGLLIGLVHKGEQALIVMYQGIG